MQLDGTNEQLFLKEAKLTICQRIPPNCVFNIAMERWIGRWSIKIRISVTPMTSLSQSVTD